MANSSVKTRVSIAYATSKLYENAIYCRYKQTSEMNTEGANNSVQQR